MADFRRQTPAGELQISVAEITEAADPLGPRLETPLVFSIARFPFAKRKSSFPNGEPEVRIHLPPAESLLRTSLSAHEEVPRARRGKENNVGCDFASASYLAEATTPQTVAVSPMWPTASSKTAFMMASSVAA